MTVLSNNLITKIKKKKEKLKISKLNYKEIKKNPDGSYQVAFTYPKSWESTFYNAAVKDNTITLKDILYQYKYNPKITFRFAVINAFIVQLLKTMIKKTT